MCIFVRNVKSLIYQVVDNNVKQMWECQWAQLKQNDPAVRDFVNKLNIVAPLNPRDAFCGGRTNAIKLYHQTEAVETVDYYDFTSSFPGPTKMVCIPSVIQKSSLNQNTLTFFSFSVWLNALCFRPTDFIIQCYRSVKMTN